jgi:uncharacterized LabA/DUF88 family protein
MKTNIYVDGFNLYYGALKDSPYRWLDIVALCQRLLPQDQVHRVRYFTANIAARPGDPPTAAQKRQRQQIYLRALQTLPEVSIHTGHYLSKVKRRPLAQPPAVGPRTVEILDTEEKGSDVNLATYLLVDAFDKDCDAAVVLSNDSDLTFPIDVVRKKFGYPVGVLNPHQNVSQALKRVASFYRQIHTNDLKAAQLLPTLTDAHGSITKPMSW